MSKEMTFEQANSKLEEIVAKMEKGDTDLDELMKLYEEAYKLLNYCTAKLQECKGQIVDINERIDKMKPEASGLFED